MAATRGSDLVVRSHAGSYRVRIADGSVAQLADLPADTAHVVIDRRLIELYAEALAPIAERPTTLLIDATEAAKSLERCPDYVEALVGAGVRRGHVLVAVGGGVIQDIVGFLAGTLLRGLDWRFQPTTLLAQADSCIGSKSSINSRGIKNVLGTFTPPTEIVIDTNLLGTLDDVDFRSGLGEILKIHAIDGPTSFAEVARAYDDLGADHATLRRFIVRSLELKRAFIEADEFDRGPRLLLNYGHSFGHAIESATAYAVPHGIAVTLGMDMANFVAARLGRADGDHFERMHPTLARNYTGFGELEISLDRMLAALRQDKKNVGDTLMLVLPDDDGVELVSVTPDARFAEICAEYLAGGRS